MHLTKNCQLSLCLTKLTVNSSMPLTVVELVLKPVWFVIRLDYQSPLFYFCLSSSNFKLKRWWAAAGLLAPGAGVWLKGSVFVEITRHSCGSKQLGLLNPQTIKAVIIQFWNPCKSPTLPKHCGTALSCCYLAGVVQFLWECVGNTICLQLAVCQYWPVALGAAWRTLLGYWLQLGVKQWCLDRTVHMPLKWPWVTNTKR